MDCIRIGFTGTRNGLRDEQKGQIVELLNQYNNIIVSHGDCVGADTDFHDLCLEYRKNNPEKTLKIHIYPPNNIAMRSFTPLDI